MWSFSWVQQWYKALSWLTDRKVVINDNLEVVYHRWSWCNVDCSMSLTVMQGLVLVNWTLDSVIYRVGDVRHCRSRASWSESELVMLQLPKEVVFTLSRNQQLPSHTQEERQHTHLHSSGSRHWCMILASRRDSLWQNQGRRYSTRWGRLCYVVFRNSRPLNHIRAWCLTAIILRLRNQPISPRTSTRLHVSGRRTSYMSSRIHPSTRRVAREWTTIQYEELKTLTPRF